MRTIAILALGIVLTPLLCLAADTNLPTTLAELDHWYVNPPPSENAASNYLAAFAAIKITGVDSNSVTLPVIGQARLPLADQSVSPAMQSALAEFTERNRPALELLEQAATLEQTRYPTDLSHGFAALLPHLSKIKHTAQVLEIIAVSHALARDGRQAGKDALTGLALANSLEQEPILISQLVRIACTVITVNGLEQTLNRTVIPSGTLFQLEKKLAPLVEQEQAGTGMARAMTGERVMDSSAFDLSADLQLKILTTVTNQNNADLSALLKGDPFAADRQFMIETFDQIEENLRLDYPQRLQVREVVEKRAEEARDKKYIISAIILPSFTKVTLRDAGGLAQLRLAQTAIALERFRAARDGHFPDSLNELVPDYFTAAPKDPFDGHNLRYHRVANGYVLYSIGMDLKDDGGMRLKGGKGDLVFSVVNPPKTP